jgi:flagellar M-ring protein FliF
MKIPQGSVKRMSISVLLDHNLRWEVENGRPKRVITPPAAEQIKTIKDLVTGIAGVDDKRGDAVVVESLAFDATLAAEPPAGMAQPSPAKPANAQPVQPKMLVLGIPMENINVIAAVGGGALLLLVGLGVWLIRRRRKSKPKVEVESKTTLPAGSTARAEAKKQLAAGIKAEIEELEAPEDPEIEALRKAAVEAKQKREVLGSISLPENTSRKAQVLTKHITDEARKQPEEVAQIVRTWLNGEEA